jgi:NDP-sugar pyrophosphorylase family protein
MDNLQGIDAVILAGGLGTRLRETVKDVPKVLAEVSGAAFLDIILEYLAKEGFKRVVLCTGYKAEDIEKRYGGAFKGMSIVFSREETPLGTGGAIKQAKTLIQSDPFVVLNGDSFCRIDFRQLVRTHTKTRRVGTITVSIVDDSCDYGCVEIDQKTLVVKGFYEKQGPRAGLAQKKVVNAGVYCFSQSLFSMMPQDSKFSLEKDFFPKLIGGQLFAWKTQESFFDIGTPERYKSAQSKKDWM